MLFNDIVYGPIHSRRLGISLGMNLMPKEHKLCSFNCIYCECGFNEPIHSPKLPTWQQVSNALEQRLTELQAQHITPDVITFSGNGEPTMHPDFLSIIEQTCSLRNKYCKTAKIAVLSNSTQLFRTDVVRALKLADQRILKLDSAINETMHLIDQPINEKLSIEDIVTMLQQFDGDFTLQTCFLRGDYKGKHIDNTTPRELQAWYDVVNLLQPKQIMIYVIDRATPAEHLQKIDSQTMHSIAAPLQEQGFSVIVSA